jgi:hypothetical protein
VTSTLVSPADIPTEQTEQAPPQSASPLSKARKWLAFPLVAIAVLLGIQVASAGMAQAASTTVYVTTASQSDVWAQLTTGEQFSIKRGVTAWGVDKVYVGPNWCIQLNAAGSISYVQGGYTGIWKTLSGARTEVQTWQTASTSVDCWGRPR